MPFGHSTSGCIVARAASLSRALNASYAFLSTTNVDSSTITWDTFECPALRFHQKLSIPHDLLVIHPDVELPSHYIDMGRRIPLRAGMRAIRISERNMHSRILFILQNLPNHFLQINVRADGKLAHAVAVLVGVSVLPEVVFQFAIVRVRLSKPVLLHVDGQRILAEVAELRAQII